MTTIERQICELFLTDPVTKERTIVCSSLDDGEFWTVNPKNGTRWRIEFHITEIPPNE